MGGGWQSGLVTAGGDGVSSPKLAYGASAPLFGAGRSACSGAADQLVSVEVGHDRRRRPEGRLRRSPARSPGLEEAQEAEEEAHEALASAPCSSRRSRTRTFRGEPDGSPRRVWRSCARADLILHGGDLSSVAFLDELRAIGPPVEAVHGNADEAAVRERLPKEASSRRRAPGSGWCTSPGLPRGVRSASSARFPGCNAVLFGHTHLPVVERYTGSGSSIPARRPSAAAGRSTRCCCSRSRRERSGPSSYASRSAHLTREHVFA